MILTVALLFSSMSRCPDPQTEVVLLEQCMVAASERWSVPTDIMRAIRRVEGGNCGSAVRNTNGSVDYGWSQTNSINLPELSQYGVTKDSLMFNPCYAMGAMAWKLSTHLSKAEPTAEGFWKAIGNYNSKTPALNKKYREKVWRALQQIRRERGETTSSR